jgi:DNA (cytosine-5)-methyltransferase 3A
MNVLSLFDGMSCGQQALERCGIVVDNYFASEIDNHAIQVTMHNYPNTKQLGSVTEVDGYKLPKIDLLIGGSPCQSFSFAGKRKGMSTKDEIEILTLEHYLELKAEGYEFEGQSYLFWEYMRLLNEVKPKYFLLENVIMGEKWEKILSKAIGVNAIEINSALVSAQNRRRLYWTNIGLEPGGLFGDLVSTIKQPKDKGITLKNILEAEVDDKYYLKQKAIDYINRDKRNLAFQMDEKDNKSICITAVFAKQIPYNQIVVHNADAIQIVAMRGRTEKKGDDWHNSTHVQKLEKRSDGKTNSITGVAKDNLLMLNENQLKKFNHNPDIEKANCLTLAQGRAGSSEEYMDAVSKIAKIQGVIRRLTPIECERLQTVKDNYTDCVSDTQRYRMLGNGWTVSVVSHIFSYLPKEYFEIKE